MTENREWKELDCIFKKVAWIIRQGYFANDDEVHTEIKCDGPRCAQFHPNFKGCSFRK